MEQSSIPTNNSNPLPPAGWLNRNVVGLGLVSLFADLCYESATAVLPSLFRLIGAPVYALGVMEGVADGISSFLKLASGWISDHFRHRKPLVLFGYGLTACSIGLMAVVVLWPVLILLRILAWVGKGLRGPPRNAILAASVPAEHRGKAFGFHRAGDTIGAILGPLMAAWLLGWVGNWTTEELTPFRMVLGWAFLPGLASVLVLVFLVKDTGQTDGVRRRFWMALIDLPVPYRRYLLGVGLFGVGDFSHTLLILAAVDLLTPSMGFVVAAQWGAILFAIHNVAGAVAAFPIGALSDRIGRQSLLVAGYCLGAVTIAGFGFVLWERVESVWVLSCLFVCAGIYLATEEALEGATAADLVGEESLRGTAFGVLGAVNGFGDLISSVVVGSLWSVAPEWAFGTATMMMLLGACVLHFTPFPKPTQVTN